MRLSLVLGTLGRLLRLYSVAFLPAAALAAWDAAHGGSWSWVWPHLVAGVLAWVMGHLLARTLTPGPILLRSEALAIVSGAWLLLGHFSAIPFWLNRLDYADGLFESVSGLTTTGASILVDFSAYDRSIFLWRALTHWIGGFGVIAMFVVVLPQMGVAGRQVFFAESSAATRDVISPRLQGTIRRILILYVVLTLLEILALLGFTTMPVFDAICNSLATISTGGFSPHPRSIEGYGSPAAEWIITAFMLVSGISFPLLWIGFFRRPRELFRDEELRVYLMVFIGCSLGIAALLAGGLPSEESLRKAAFNVSTLISACGFATQDWNLAPWSEAARMLLMLALLTCACAGSTGGGPKVIRWILTFKFMHRELLRVLHPRGVLTIRHRGQAVAEDALRTIVAVVAVYCLGYLVFGAVLTLLGTPMVPAFSGAIACINNAGPGFGVFGPMDNYASLGPAGTLVCTVAMWLGRLEFVTLLVLLHPDVLRKVRWRAEGAAPGAAA